MMVNPEKARHVQIAKVFLEEKRGKAPRSTPYYAK